MPEERRRRTLARSGRLAAELGAALALGAALWLVLAQAEGLWPTGALEQAGRLAYRAVFWPALPATLLLRGGLPQTGESAFGPAAVALATALAALGLLWLRRGLRRARRATRAAGPVATPALAGLGLPWLRRGLRRARLARRAAPVAAPVARPVDAPEDPGRRLFVSRVAKGAAGAAVLGLSGYGSLVEPERVRLRSFVVPVRDLPAWAEGLRLVHLTDTHYGPFVSLGYLESVVLLANRARPDLVVLTGDYVHRSPGTIEPGIGALAGLRGRLGRLAVLGNHDHWEGADRCREAFGRARIPLVDGRRLFLGPGGLGAEPAPGSICVGGLGDLWEDPSPPERVLRGVPASTPRLLLSHNPDAAELVEAGTRVDLMLSGHTHGGQVRLPGLGTPVLPSAHGDRYASGLCQGPRCPVVVSCGVGLAILPVRLGVRPEVGLVELRRA